MSGIYSLETEEKLHPAGTAPKTLEESVVQIHRFRRISCGYKAHRRRIWNLTLGGGASLVRTGVGKTILREWGQGQGGNEVSVRSQGLPPGGVFL